MGKQVCLVIVASLFIITVVLFGARSARAQEAASLSEDTSSTSVATSTPAASGDTAGTATSTPATFDYATSTPTIFNTAVSSTPPVSESIPLPPPPPVTEPPSSPPAQETIAPPAVQPIVPFISANGSGFDPATAPSKVRLKILNPDGSVPIVPVFVTLVGVGGRTYGGPIDREGNLETIMPTGRYYTDILVIDTKAGPPANPPSFFLEANEERDFGVLVLTDKSSFTDSALEREVAATLDGNGGLAKMVSLIVKLLLAILKELSSMRSELLGR